MSRFKISVSSKFEELWRYNITLVCELCSKDGERKEYRSEESFIAPVGANLNAAPADYPVARTLTIESGEGYYVNLLVYVVPHTLPTTDDIYKTKPFSLIVKVESGTEIVVNQAFEINQWSGDNISLERVGAQNRE